MKDSSLSYKVFFEHETSRMIFQGAQPSDIKKVFDNTEEEEDWINNWSQLAKKEEIEGDSDRKRSFMNSAYNRYLRASNYYNLAQYHILKDSPTKKKFIKKSIEVYKKAIKLKENKIKEVKIRYKDIEITGYLHLPEGVESAPCVVCIPGLPHTKENMHNWCQCGVESGLAVFIADGPGYGETRVLKDKALNFKDFTEYIQIVVDSLSSLNVIDSDKIGVLGDCFGGYLAFKSLLEEKRIKVCAIIEGILDATEYKIKGDPLPDLIRYYVEENELDNFYRIGELFFKSKVREDVAIYMLHAEIDDINSLSKIQEIYDAIDSDKELEVVKGKAVYNNYLNDHYNAVLDQLDRYLPLAWDWIYGKLNQ